jgi:hypothetical protein
MATEASSTPSLFIYKTAGTVANQIAPFLRLTDRSTIGNIFKDEIFRTILDNIAKQSLSHYLHKINPGFKEAV